MQFVVPGVVDQWTLLLRANMEASRAQMRDNGAEAGCSLDVGLARPARLASVSHHTHHFVACIVQVFENGHRLSTLGL